jgi:membrane protein YdbS with pleckstrin-like domain
VSRAPSPPSWPYRPPGQPSRYAATPRRDWLARVGLRPHRSPGPPGSAGSLGSQSPPQGFKGQLAGERVIWHGRRSALYLLATGWPLPAGLLVVQALGLAGDALGAFALPIMGVGALLLVMFAVWWIATHAWGWFFQRYMLTDERVIKSVGWLARRREEIELGHIVQVRVDQRNPVLIALGMGDVELRTAGDPILLLDVAHPHNIADSILAAMDSHAQKKAKASPSQVSNPWVQAVLDELARPDPMPPAPPLRRSAPPGFGRRTIPVRLLPEETLVEVVYRHWFVLACKLPLAASPLVAGIVLGAALAASGGEGWPALLTLGGIGCSAVAGFLAYLNWADDVFILTTRRLVDINRLFFVLAETSNDAAYGQVQNVRVQQGLSGKLLGFGSILVETAGRKHPLEMKDIPHAFDVMNRIFGQMSQAKERDRVAAGNKQKQENALWLSAVLSRLLVTVPDLRGLPLLRAIAVARESRLKLVVGGEREIPGRAPGQVLEQAPCAGTCVVSEAEVRVLLSSTRRTLRPRP